VRNEYAIDTVERRIRLTYRTRCRYRRLRQQLDADV